MSGKNKLTPHWHTFINNELFVIEGVHDEKTITNRVEDFFEFYDVKRFVYFSRADKRWQEVHSMNHTPVWRVPHKDSGCYQLRVEEWS